MESQKISFGKLSALFVLASLFSVIQGEILNHAQTLNLTIQENEYSQFRVSGVGNRDEGLEDAITNVNIYSNITLNDYYQDERKKKDGPPTMDVFIFNDVNDYYCYIEAVSLLNNNQKCMTCSFVSDTSVAKLSTNSHMQKSNDFLEFGIYNNDQFIVVDNTLFPELANDMGLSTDSLVDCDAKTLKQMTSDQQPVTIEYSLDTDFTSNDHYQYLIHNAVFVLIGFFVVFTITFLMYCKQKSIYNRLVKAKAEQRRRELLEKESMYGRYIPEDNGGNAQYQQVSNQKSGYAINDEMNESLIDKNE